MGLRHLSFRDRLRLFFVVIVVVPMITMAVVLYQLVVASEKSQTDARLAEAQTVATGAVPGVDSARPSRSRRTSGRTSSSPRRSPPTTRRRCRIGSTTLTRRAGARVRRAQGRREGHVHVRRDAGGRVGHAPALQDQDGKPTGRITVAMRRAEGVRAADRDPDGLEVVVGQDGNAACDASSPTPPRQLPERGRGHGRRARLPRRRVHADAVDGNDPGAALLMPDRDSADRDVERIAGRCSAPSLGFLALAFAFALDRRRARCRPRSSACSSPRSGSGAGDFSRRGPDRGQRRVRRARARSSTRWPRQLEARLEELQRERARLQEAIRRVGESIAAGLDRVGAARDRRPDRGRRRRAPPPAARRCAAAPRTGCRRSPRTGEPEAYRRALHAAEAAVIDAGQVAEIQLGGASALAAPLGAPRTATSVRRHRLGRPRRPAVHRRASASCSPT